MNNTAMNFTTTGPSANSSSENIDLLKIPQACIYIINLLFCLPAHSYVIYLIVTGAGSGLAAEFFTLNLSVCEIGICLKSLIFVLSMWLPSLSIIDVFLVGFSMTCRPLFQCLICVERYLAVVHPVTFLKFKPLRYRLICCIAVWISTLGFSCFCVFTIYRLPIVYVWCSSVLLIIFLFIQLFCCVAVLRALKQSGPGERGREREEENHMKKKAFYLILITTVTTLFTYGPFTITGLFYLVTNANFMAPWVVSLSCFLMAGFVHPFLYLHRTGKISCLCCPRNQLL
nr:C-C chemokine receptor type 8-like [Misgurnus anguillicaudatus]